MNTVLSDYLHGKGSLQAVTTAADFALLCDAVAADAAGRLRWQLLRRLGLVPWEGRPGRDELLYAAAQLHADRDAALEALCPTCRAVAEAERCARCGAPLPIQNQAFDEDRYEELKRHGNSEL